MFILPLDEKVDFIIHSSYQFIICQCLACYFRISGVPIGRGAYWKERILKGTLIGRGAYWKERMLEGALIGSIEVFAENKTVVMVWVCLDTVGQILLLQILRNEETQPTRKKR